MVQVSGTFGSRQEEAQRLGRILRPKEGEKPATFYTLVTRDTREMDFAHHRQLFLTEQGYSYEILDERDFAGFEQLWAKDAEFVGGANNTAGGDFSFAAGRRAKANHTSSFVWADNTAADFASTARAPLSTSCMKILPS